MGDLGTDMVLKAALNVADNAIHKIKQLFKKKKKDKSPEENEKEVKENESSD